MAIYYGKVGKLEGGLQLVGYSNSNFAGNLGTLKSTYKYLFKLAGRLISWKSKRATTIALSTVEAKTDALTKVIKEVQ